MANTHKTCKHCKTRYRKGEHDPSFRNWCSAACGVELARAAQRRAWERQKKQERAEIRARKEKLKTKSDWMKEAQQAVNEYVRMRDMGRRCISCDAVRQARWRSSHFDCGHFRSVGAASHLRFHLLNTAAQCVRCNRDLSGNAVEFRKGLVKRYGESRVVELEHDNTPRKFDIEYLRRIKSIFKRRARLYRKLRERRMAA